MGDGYDDVAGRDPGELADRRRRIAEVLEDLQAEDEVEGVVGERQLGDARRPRIDCRQPLADAIDAVGGEVDRGDPLPEQGPEPDQRLALAAAGVERARRRDRGDRLAEAVEEPADHPLDDRVAGLELDLVGGAPGCLCGRHRET